MLRGIGRPLDVHKVDRRAMLQSIEEVVEFDAMSSASTVKK